MSRGALFDPLFGADRVAARLDDAAWVAALVAVEVALAQAAADHGVVPVAHAEAIAAALDPAALDPAALGRDAVEGGNPVIPLVRLLRTAAGEAGRSVHRGATSQDVMDTATVLLAGWAGEIVLDDLRGAADAAAHLAAAHRDTPMAARTLGQQALPTTFGLVAAGWCAGLDRARARLAEVLAVLPVQLGGPAGTLDGLPIAVVGSLAGRLGLAAPDAPWHAERTRIGELAAALGVAAGACAKPATDVVALAATEVGEVGEGAPGDSSSMPHKRNPIAAVTARAAARRAPGLVAVLLAAMDGEHQRAAGAWHAEWETLADLLRATGGAAARLRVSLDGLVVHADRMADRLPAAPDTGRAAQLVDRILAARTAVHPLDVIVRYYDGCSAGDVDEMLATLHPDVVHWFLAPNVGSAPVAGAEHLARYWRKVAAMIEARWVVDHCLAAPIESGRAEAVIEWTMFWRPPGSAERVATRGAEWFTLAPDGRISEIRSYYQQREQTTELAGFPYAERGYSTPGAERSALHPAGDVAVNGLAGQRAPDV